MAGVADLAMEARFLSGLRHPNIITLHGRSTTGPFSGDFFLLLDRLDHTLTQQLHKWKKQQPGSLFTDRHGSKAKDLFLWRCQVAHDVSSGFRTTWSSLRMSSTVTLLSNRVMYRDVKADNVGFTPDGQVKLFDFDICKEYNPLLRNQDGLYNLTGNTTGSIIFMAPEVYLNKPYNESIDVYSFSILLCKCSNWNDPMRPLP
jgi:serine/threonine protein kinase